MDIENLLKSDNDDDFELGRQIFNKRYEKLTNEQIEYKLKLLGSNTKFYYVCRDKRLMWRFVKTT